MEKNKKNNELESITAKTKNNSLEYFINFMELNLNLVRNQYLILIFQLYFLFYA